jgi:hypothetical protein
MSHKHQNQSHSSSSSDDKEKQKVIHPDLILVGDKEEYSSKENQRMNSSSNSTADWLRTKNPLTVRLLAMVGFVGCILFMLGILVGTGIFAISSLLFLFRNQKVNRVFFTYLNLLSNTIIAATGCLLGVLSPMLGFSFLLLYFSVSDPIKLFKSIFSRAFRR